MSRRLATGHAYRTTLTEVQFEEDSNGNSSGQPSNDQITDPRFSYFHHLSQFPVTVLIVNRTIWLLKMVDLKAVLQFSSPKLLVEFGYFL